MARRGAGDLGRAGCGDHLGYGVVGDWPAAGDVAANMGLPLTPVASYDGAVVANNLLKGNTLKSNYRGLPSVVFTIPH